MKKLHYRPVSNSLFLCVILLLLALTSSAGTQCAGRNTITLRGQQESIYYYPATGSPLNRRILFAPGDGGWRGWAITVAQTMASWGYDVYGFDTKEYLADFTGGRALRETEVMSDFRQIAQWVTTDSGERVTLVGWSEGAGLCVLAAAALENKKIFDGIITFGLGNDNALGWRWQDSILTLAGKAPAEPTFQAARYVARIAPLRFVMIQSSRDEYVPLSEAQSLHTAAREPKRLTLVSARDHKFSDNNAGFFRGLNEGLQWIRG